MSWILLAVGAQFLNAIVAIIDKRIVSDDKLLPQPFVYAFYTCLFSGIWIVFYLISLLPLPFESFHIPSFHNVIRPTLEVVALAFLSAYTFFIGLLSMFTAFQKADASDVVPVVGATSTIASFGLGYFFLNAPVTHSFALGICILALGTVLVSRYHFTLQTALTAMHAGLFFAFHYVAIKGLFLVTSFDNAFFWSRIAFMLFALTLLMVPAYYEKISVQTKTTTSKTGWLIFFSKIAAGVSTFLVLKATALGDVAVVQALGGLQYVFVLILGIFFTYCPDKSGGCEQFPKDSILRKTIFVAVIAVGFLILFK